ncbi:MAG: UDP-N-acetylmuramoyl-tripeptide--D-alanyl-D-alanine ligase, partial [Angelakisella sp.]
MEALRTNEIALALGIDHPLGDGMVTNICTDSREATEGSLFVAIPGERVDGHDYVEKALSQGAALALVERDGNYPPDRTLLVDNTVKAMLRLAAWYRDRVPAKVVAITGSVGKTTTKDMIAAVLSAGFRTIKTIGNQNNEIGTPRTILSIDRDTEAAVIEMGMSGFGEIQELALAAKPQIGVITNIGVSHMEHLGSRENILKAKLELAQCLPDGATLFLCADNDLLERVEIPRLHVLFYGVDNEEADIRGIITHSTPVRTDFTICYNGQEWQANIPATGKHLVQNALAAFGIGLSLGMEPETAIAALSDYRPSGMRQNVVDKGGIT